MEEKILRVAFGSPENPLEIGKAQIQCYVLEDGTRVLSSRGMQEALAIGHGNGALSKSFLERENLRPFISRELAEAFSSPIRFVPPGRGSKPATAYEAAILADICDAVLEAYDEGVLVDEQFAIAEQCKILARSFAKVGIVALVDEATGHQELRDREALHAILDKHLKKELAAWAKRFPDEFYREMFRLNGWQWKGMNVNRPSVVGKYTKGIVYERLEPGVIEELHRTNPGDAAGDRKSKQHRWLTNDIGHPALAQHLYAVLGLMKVSSNWRNFLNILQRAFSKKSPDLDLFSGNSEAEF